MKKRILIVDDEADFTFLMKKNLEAAGGYEVVVCNQARSAVPQARELRPHLVLLDIMMPEMPGEEIAFALKNQRETKDTPVVFLTALVKPEEAANASHMIGQQIFVAKPVKIQELIKVIEQVTA